MPASLSEAPEFPEETAAIVAATADLFDKVEADLTSRNLRPVISGPITATPARLDVVTGKADVLIENGPVDHLTGYRITWYPVDRFLGSVDFMGTWDSNRNLVCGYITWDLSDPGKPVLNSVSAGFVDLSELDDQGDEDIHAALLDANCAYGAIEANYAFFE